jgi:hypothetical protein
MAVILGAAYSQFCPSAPVRAIAPNLAGKGIPLPSSRGTVKVEAMSRSYRMVNGEKVIGISLSLRYGAYSGEKSRTVIFIPMSEFENVSLTFNGVILPE